jgi:lipoprotein NlpI
MRLYVLTTCLVAQISKADILEDLYPLQRAPMSCYSRALRLHAGSQLARLKHALAAAKRGFMDIAIKELSAARATCVGRGSSDETEKTMIEELGAMIMIQAVMPVKASLTLDRLVASTDQAGSLSASLLAARGVLHQQQHDAAAARADFARAVQADPSDADAHYNLGCFRMQELDWRGAFASFTKTISLQPKQKYAYLNRGVSLYQMHRVEEALRDFNSALSLDPEFGQALLNRGVMQQVAGRHAEAEQDLSKTLELMQGSKEAWQGRVNLYQSLGRKELALRDNAALIAVADAD